MKRRLFLLAFCGMSLRAYPETAETAAVRKVLEEQAAAWNRGDLVKFVDSYAEDAVFVGTEITYSKEGVLARYRKKYDTAEKRGKLQFSDLGIRYLGNGFAYVTGRFRLTRTAAGGGDSSGIFSLMFHKKGPVWKIILDHTA